ncbi:MAG: alpha-hydroxy-acid oxidizing protein, partial [Candidatus Heimdallarchaeaceae archaeon]
VGYGFSLHDTKMIAETGVELIDVGGSGGTNWTKVELLRDKSLHFYSSSFINLGISTVDSIRNAVMAKKGEKPAIIASGGVWSGLDAVKALLLGADYVACALPVLKSFNEKGEEGIRSYLSAYISEMKIVLALLGLQNIEQLKLERDRILKQNTVDI